MCQTILKSNGSTLRSATSSGETTHSKPPESQKYDDFFYELQWGHGAVHAAKAWQYGRGEGVRVALLDNGIDADHKDIGPNLNTELSVSFVPQENWPARSGFYFHHGTHVAGLIAAAENSYGGIGVAPKSELVAVKVASESTGSGAFSWLLRGIVYAAEQQADIAHIGLGAMLPKERVSGLAAVELQDMLEVVARHAYDKGVLLFAPAGDDQKNLDDCCLYLPGGAEPFITVSAVSPKGWAFDPYTNLHLAASYSNFGQTYADLSAPGGDVQHPGNEECTIAGMKRPCWVFDLVFSTTAEGWAWASGTSAASAHAAGVAALIKSWHTDASPDELESLLLSYATKAGKKPGKDVFYGPGYRQRICRAGCTCIQHTRPCNHSSPRRANHRSLLRNTKLRFNSICIKTTPTHSIRKPPLIFTFRTIPRFASPCMI